MNKAIKYGINGAVIGAGVLAFIEVFKQLSEKERANGFDWVSVFKSAAKGATIGAVGGLIVGAIEDDRMNETLIAAGGIGGVINEALENYSDESKFFLIRKAESLQRKLGCKFKGLLSCAPTFNGSIQRGTSIASSDIDINLRFTKEAGTVSKIRSIVEEYLTNEFSDSSLVDVRSQEHSIGLFFSIQREQCRIDVVPMREIENGKGDTFIFSTKRETIKKTNAIRQNKVLRFTEKQKHIIKLLKGWKIENNVHIPSVFLEHLVVRAYEDVYVPRGLKNALFTIIEYIGNEIPTIRIVDPANTNNIISESLTYQNKEQIQEFCFKMLGDIKKDERNILDYFSI